MDLFLAMVCVKNKFGAALNVYGVSLLLAASTGKLCGVGERNLEVRASLNAAAHGTQETVTVKPEAPVLWPLCPVSLYARLDEICVPRESSGTTNDVLLNQTYGERMKSTSPISSSEVL